MKRMLLAVCCVCFLLTACQTGVPAYRLRAAQIQMIEAYTGGVPAAAVKKTLDGEADIHKAVDCFNRLLILGPDTREETAGGIGYTFALHMKDGGTEHIWLTEDGRLFWKGEWRRVSGVDLPSLWESLDAPQEQVSETDLPQLER